MEASRLVMEKKKDERRLTRGYIKLRSIRMHFEKTGNKASHNLTTLFVGSVSLIFTKGDLKEVSEEVAKYKVRAPMHVGLVAPMYTIVPPDNTSLDASHTSFFQVLTFLTILTKVLWKSSPILSSSRRVIMWDLSKL